MNRIVVISLKVEMHVYFQQRGLASLCQKHGITMVAYSPLGSKSMKAIMKQVGIE
jgi:alcohol dehydrogenase (NADP+)